MTRVKLLIGKLSGVIPDALRFAFKAISMGGIAEEAPLEIEEVPLRIKCIRCGKTSILEDPFMVCPHCEGTDVELIQGRELEIRSVEIEDGNQAGQESP